MKHNKHKYIIGLFVCLACARLCADTATEPINGSRYSPQDVMSGLLARQDKATMSGMAFRVERVAGYSTKTVEGKLATNKEMFLLRSLTQTARGHEDNIDHYDYGHASDGTEFFRLRNRVKEVSALDAALTQYDENTASLLANPIFLILHDGYKSQGPVSLLDPAEVLAIQDNGEAGTVSVTIDGTKRTDYSTITYEFAPDHDWALVKMDCYSDANLVATCRGEGFFRAPGSGVENAAKWEYRRLSVDRDDLHTLREAKAQFEPLADFDFEDPKSFRIQFPADAITPAQARDLGAVMLGLSVDAREKPLARDSDPKSPTVTAQDAATTSGDTQTHQQEAKAASPPSDVEGIKQSPGLLVLALCIVAFLVTSITIAFYHGLTSREKTLIVSKWFFLFALVAAGWFIALGLKARLGSHLESAAADRETQSTHQHNSPSERSWPDEFTDKSYKGSVTLDKGTFSYSGHLTRTGGVEINRWYEGMTQTRMQVEKETARKFAGESEAPTTTFFQPSFYAILASLAKTTGQRVDVLAGTQQEVPLDAIGLLDQSLKNPAKNPRLMILPSASGGPTILLKYADATQASLRLQFLDDGLSVSEEYEYYDEHGAPVFHYTMQYQ